MCECWEFNCGHTTTIECQEYKNRILFASGGYVIDDDDPFTDAGAPQSPAKDRPTRVHSNSNPSRPPQFFLPSSTPSSVTSDTDTISSAPSIHRDNITGSHGPGRAVKNTDPFAIPKLPPRPPPKISTCGGPDHKKRKTDDECYDCILQKARNNTAFQQNEQAAATKLYEEISRQGNYASNEDRHHLMSGRDDNAQPHARTMPGNPGYRNNAVDLGRGNPPRGPRRGSTAQARGVHHQASSRAPAPLYYAPQTQNHFLDYSNYQGPGPPGMLNPNDAYQNEPQGLGPLAQYLPAPHNDLNQFQRQVQQNPYSYPLDPYGAPPQSPYPQYLYPQMEMEMEMQYQGQGQGESQYEHFAYPEGPQMGYGYYQGM